MIMRSLNIVRMVRVYSQGIQIGRTNSLLVYKLIVCVQTFLLVHRWHSKAS